MGFIGGVSISEDRRWCVCLIFFFLSRFFFYYYLNWCWLDFEFWDVGLSEIVFLEMGLFFSFFHVFVS